jgi:hypothetical protein
VTGGCDSTPAWLGGGEGYIGTIDKIEGKRAVVKLDEEIVLEARNSDGWPDFGPGSAHEIGRLATARGQWLALSHGWVGQEWKEPIGRVHVGLLQTPPDIENVPSGGGLGAWVESHATMTHLALEGNSRN